MKPDPEGRPGSSRPMSVNDPDDPFGSCPDEKPPAGWNEGFWDGVRDRIEQSRELPGGAPDHRRVPEPPGGRRRAQLIALLLAVASGALGLLAGVDWSRPERPPESRVLVRVFADREPPVVVNWARAQGATSSFVLLESVTPEISYLMLTPEPAPRAVAAARMTAPRADR